jgi:hypothetical protein
MTVAGELALPVIYQMTVDSVREVALSVIYLMTVDILLPVLIIVDSAG